ncbi:hypothetical protein ATCC51562_744 [Campylobacter concisus ATCC 51562]|uniref:Uncharacterized protein n=1 Tax=Campylobacter concisus ATCC 51562 TaxID=1242969 RepID=U2EMG2_9BACT|nr:hypothetical protein ATCC51562_744 [Campylobacter concisus ATCC 51562]
MLIAISAIKHKSIDSLLFENLSEKNAVNEVQNINKSMAM